MDEYLITDELPDGLAEGPVDRRVKAIIDYAIDTFIQKTKISPGPRVRGIEDILVEDWLCTTTTDVVTDTFKFAPLDKNLTAWAFDRCLNDDMGPFRSCELEKCSGDFEIDLPFGSVYKCTKAMIECGLGKEVSLPVNGCVLLEHKSTKVHAFVMYDLCYNGHGCNFKVFSAPSEVDIAKLLKECIIEHRNAENFYNKACLGFESGCLKFVDHSDCSWDDIVIPSDIKQGIIKNSVSVLKNAELMYQRGLAPNRNILLVSPPGMAKTTIFKAVSNQVSGLVTRIWCTGKSIQNSSDVSDLFKCARELSPCILFVEDMDLFGKDRNNLGTDGYILNEFLNCLDGLHDNPGIVVMASTNDHDSMDKALTHRPGRFDVKLKMPFPSPSERSHILMRQLAKLGINCVESCEKSDWDDVVELTEGLTGAYLAEIAKACFLNTLDRTQDPKCSKFGIQDMRDACSQVMSSVNMSGC